MDEETVVQAAPETTDAATNEIPAEAAPATNEIPTAEATPEPEDTRPAWVRALDEAPVEELRRHRKFAGIVGGEKQRWQAEYENQRAEQIRLEAAAKEREDLERLAQENPVAFADRWLGEAERKKAAERLSKLEIDARKTVADQIGRSFHSVPEWAEIIADPDAFARITAALQGKADADVLPAFNAAALEAIAERRAEKRAEARAAERLRAERAAWETEARAQGFLATDRPDLSRPAKAGRGPSWMDLPPGPEFDRHYEQHVLNRSR
jgi:hypothetical protein